MTVIGRRKVEFTAQDGNQIQGVSLYVSYPITKNGEGMAAEKIFLSAKKLENLDFLPEIGDEINVQYNRYGKVDTITPVGM